VTEPALSILLFKDVEKPAFFLDHYFGALKEWNADGLDEIEVILISQHEDSEEFRQVALRQPFDVHVIDAGHPMVDGYPVWDIFEELRLAMPMARGRWVTTHHTEFLWCKGRLRRTLDWLKEQRLYMALGNLRRPMRPKVDKVWSKEGSDELHQMLAADDWQAAGDLAEALPTNHWIYWLKEPKPGPTRWHEDIFFADREWLEAWRFPDHGGRLPFQDVYDVMGRATDWLERYQLMPKMVRMPMEVNRTIHLWHDKLWGSWTPAMRDYFLENAEWRNTAFGDKRIWQGLLATHGNNGNGTGAPVVRLRTGQGGTVTRYGDAMKRWLLNGGRPELSSFYAEHGKELRER
jgi:hypothetical protein